MVDTEDIRYNKPADRLIEAIEHQTKDLEGVDLEAKEVLKIATDVLKRRLGL